VKTKIMTPIIYLSVKKDVPATGYWDHEFIKDIFSDIPQTDRMVFVIPGAYQWDVTDEINVELNKFEKVLVIITSDEECKFNVNKLKHPNMILYSQYGNGGYFFPLGYPPGTRHKLKMIGIKPKTMNWFFSGQITHARRKMMAEELRPLDNGWIKETNGFARGLCRTEYLTNLAASKTAPCPPGAVSVDTFRFYEALEAGCCPIADDVKPLQSFRSNYFVKLFSDLAFPTFTDYADLKMLIKKSVDYPNMNNKVMAWWINKKYQLKERIKQDLGVKEEEIAVVIPVSPIQSHPDTAMIEETINSIRVHHPDAPIIITMDGVREEQEDRRADYEEFQKRLLWKINFEYKNILPVIFDKHIHQSGMMNVVLEHIKVPMILYVEHDTPLTPDRTIDWEKCKDYIRSGKSNVIRFHFEELIPKEHEYLMFGKVEDDFIKTFQWSQRPHLASTAKYREIMDLFSPGSNCFIEDFAYGQLINKCLDKGLEGWNDWKVHIYHPEGGIKRSYNLDGRKDDHKWVKEQVW